MKSIKHATTGLARPCSAHDLMLVSGGLQCGNCLQHNVPPLENPCQGQASDGPCPLQAEAGATLCWIHAMGGSRVSVQVVGDSRPSKK